MSLLFDSALAINGSRETVYAFVNFGNVAGALVVAHDVLPRVALFAQHGIPVIVGKAAYALDGRGLFLLNRRAVGEGRRWGTVEGDGSRLMISVRLDRRHVCHNPAVARWKGCVRLGGSVSGCLGSHDARRAHDGSRADDASARRVQGSISTRWLISATS